MKNIKDYLINEARKKEIHFSTKGAYAIFAKELIGQISDGYWENERPASHWKWVLNTTPVYDKNGENYYTGAAHTVQYKTDWVYDYVKKAVKNSNSEHGWAIRIFNYAKMANIIPDNQFTEFMKDIKDNLGICSYLPFKKPDDIDSYINDKTSNNEYAKKYFDSIKNFGDDIITKFYDSKYGIKDFEKDLKNAEQAMNTLK